MIQKLVMTRQCRHIVDMSDLIIDREEYIPFPREVTDNVCRLIQYNTTVD